MRGQTLFEIVIALAIFSMVASILVGVSLGGFTALTQGGDHTKASALATEGIEALRSIRDGAWNELRPAGGSQTDAVRGAIAVSGAQWVFNAGAPAETLGKFTRSITLDAACRDRNTRAFQACTNNGVVPDIHTERATVTVRWETRPGVSNAVTRSSYITSWDSKTWTQTDWSVSGRAVWIPTTIGAELFASDDGAVDSVVSGEVQLKKSNFWILDNTFNWSTLVGGNKKNFNGVDAVNNKVWVVGDGGVVVKYDGSSWSNVAHTLGGSSINAVDVLSATDVWMVGNSGKIYHFIGGRLIEDQDTGSHVWNSVSMISPTLGFAVGNGGWMARYNGLDWVTSQITPTAGDLYRVSMLSPIKGFVVGAGGKLFSWNGTAWSEHHTGRESWRGIDIFADGSNGWVVGSKNILPLVNGQWGAASSPPGASDLNAVSFFNATKGWAVGDRGAIIFWDGAGWTGVSSPVSGNLSALVVNTSGGWAVGVNGTILKLQSVNDYFTIGSLISSAFPLVGISPVESIEWDEQIPRGCVECLVKFQIQTSSDGTTWFPAQWMGPDGDDGDTTDYFTRATGHLIPHIVNGRQWVRYRAELTGDGANTPILKEVRIQYK